jgi:hypothetical protein
MVYGIQNERYLILKLKKKKNVCVTRTGDAIQSKEAGCDAIREETCWNFGDSDLLSSFKSL